MRPDDPRYAALALAEAPQTDARVAFVISGWGVLDPLLRYHLAKQAGNAELVGESPRLLGRRGDDERGQPAGDPRPRRKGLPSAGAGVWRRHRRVGARSKPCTASSTAGGNAGGEVELQLYPGPDHGFMTGKPDAPYAGPAIERMKAFIRKHTG